MTIFTLIVQMEKKFVQKIQNGREMLNIYTVIVLITVFLNR